VADLLIRHGHVLDERDTGTTVAPAGDPGGDAGRRPFPARRRWTLILAGCAVAAGSLLGGAVAVSDAGHDTRVGPVPGGLLDQLTRGASGGLPAAPDVPADADAPGGPTRPGERPTPAAGGPQPRPAGTGPSTVLVPVPVPAPRAPAVVPGSPAATDPPALGSGGTTDPDRSAPAPAARSTGDDRDQGTTGAAADQVAPPSAATGTPAGSGTGGIADTGEPAEPGGLVGGVTDTVGGLLGG
jgi:hypothetical protein